MDHTLFEVHGSFEVPVETLRNGRRIKTRCPEFWEACPELATKRGCYVFAIRAGRGFRPIYVAKAAKQGFAHECFTTHKTGERYNPALLNTGRGTPVRTPSRATAVSLRKLAAELWR